MASNITGVNITLSNQSKISDHFNAPTSQDIICGIILGLVAPVVVVVIYISYRLRNPLLEEDLSELIELRPLPKSQFTEDEQVGVPTFDRIRPFLSLDTKDSPEDAELLRPTRYRKLD